MRRGVLTLFLALGAWAQGLYSPYAGAYLLPLRTLPGAEGAWAAFRGYLANHLSYAQGDWGEMGFDLEEARLEVGLGLRRGSWQAGVYLPFSLYYGGFLDYLLDPFHKALALPYNREQGQVLLFARRGEEGRRWQGPVFGPRDPYLRLDGFLGPVRAFAALAFPLGDPGRFLGSGGWRVLLGGGWTWEEGEAWLGATLPLGRQAGLEPFGEGPSLSALLRWEGPLKPLAVEAEGFWGPRWEAGPFAYGLALRLRYGAFSFAEDLWGKLPDVVLSWEGVFPLPSVSSP